MSGRRSAPITKSTSSAASTARTRSSSLLAIAKKLAPALRATPMILAALTARPDRCGMDADPRAAHAARRRSRDWPKSGRGGAGSLAAPNLDADLVEDLPGRRRSSKPSPRSPPTRPRRSLAARSPALAARACEALAHRRRSPPRRRAAQARAAIGRDSRRCSSRRRANRARRHFDRRTARRARRNAPPLAFPDVEPERIERLDAPCDAAARMRLFFAELAAALGCSEPLARRIAEDPLRRAARGRARGDPGAERRLRARADRARLGQGT